MTRIQTERKTGRDTGEAGKKRAQSMIHCCAQRCLTRTLPNNFKTSWAEDPLLIISSSQQELMQRKKNGDMGREWKIKPWMRVYLPQKSRPFALLLWSTPRNKLRSLLLHGQGAPTVPTAVRLGAPWLRRNTCVRARVYRWPNIPGLLLCTTKRGCQSAARVLDSFPSERRLKPRIQIVTFL